MILGVIGGIGSGKSTVAKWIAVVYGYCHLSTDDLAQEMMNGDEELKNALREAFGEVYKEDGILDKKKYAGILYSDAENRKKNDEIVHPLVWKKVKELTAGEGNFVVETALPGPEFKTLCDKIFAVYVGEDERIHRLMESRGYTKEYALSIIRGQQPDSFYEAFSDLMIDNSGSFLETTERIRKEMEN